MFVKFKKVFLFAITALLVIVGLGSLFAMASAQQGLQYTVDNVVVVDLQPEVGAANIGDSPGDIRPAVMNDGVIKVSWRDAVDSEGKVVSGWFSTQFGKVEFSKAIGESRDGDIVKFDSKAAGWAMVAGETPVTFYILVDGVELAPQFDILYVGKAPVLLSCEMIELCKLIIKYWVDPVFRVERSQADGSFVEIYKAEHTAEKGEVGPFELGTEQPTIVFRVWAIDAKTQRVRGYLEVRIENPCYQPPATTEVPTITPTTPVTPTVTPTVPFTPTIVITPTITPTTPAITETPTVVPTPASPTCSSVVWTLSGELVAEGTDATALVTIQNFVPGTNVQIVSMSSTNSDPEVLASSAPVTETMSIAFRAWPGTTSGVMINGAYQPTCENSWPIIEVEVKNYQIYLPFAPNSTQPTVKYCSIALNLDPQGVNLGESASLPTAMRPVTWTGDIAYVTSTAWTWHPAIVSPDGEVLVWAFLNAFHQQTYISKLAVGKDQVELPLDSSTLNEKFSLFSELFPFKDSTGLRHDSLHVQATFHCRSTGLFPQWREELLHGTAQSANVEQMYLAIGDAAK